MQTLLGNIAVNTNIKLSPGTEILIQFRTHRPPFEVLLVPQHNQQSKTQASHTAHDPKDKLSLGHNIQGMFLNKSSDQGKSPLPNDVLKLPAGKSFQLRVEILPLSLRPETASKPVQGQTTTSPTNPTTQSVAPTRNAPVTSPALNANTLNATVIGLSKGQPIVQTSLGNIQLSLKAPIPIGTQMTLTFSPMNMDDSVIATGDGPLRNSNNPMMALRSTENYNLSLQSALSTLSQQGQGNPLVNHIPHQGSALTSGILLFLNAIKSGSNKPWVGQDTLSILRATGNSELAQQLSNENAIFNRPVETNQGDWRMTQLPILHEGSLQKANLFVRDREAGSQGEGKLDREDATRFKLEVEMSRDGDMQFDGLVKRNRFDLVIRSRGNLPSQMQSKISDLFYGANEATGFSGRLSFEASLDWEKLSTVADKLIAGTHNSTVA
ncbi:hypothetical protein [Kiloniella sp.]|uniref:hypothetical protein n=1 Tax=Kiloniella sp. TaxID=1938587 RepID=UPI003B01A252